MNTTLLIVNMANLCAIIFLLTHTAHIGGCGSVDRVLDFESGGSKFVSHCSQNVVVSLGKTLHPKLLLWGLPTVLSM